LSFGRAMFPRSRPIFRADQAAHSALTKILKVSTFGSFNLLDDHGQPLDRDAVADRIQEYWDKNKRLPLVERWYRTLADDQASAGDWMMAAENIVGPTRLQ